MSHDHGCVQWSQNTEVSDGYGVNKWCNSRWLFEHLGIKAPSTQVRSLSVDAAGVCVPRREPRESGRFCRLLGDGAHDVELVLGPHADLLSPSCGISALAVVEFFKFGGGKGVPHSPTLRLEPSLYHIGSF